MKRQRRLISWVVLCAVVAVIAGVYRVVMLGGATALGAGAAGGVTASSPEMAASFQTTMLPLLQEYCYQCHANGQSKGDLTLGEFKTIEDVKKNPRVWNLVLENVKKGEMPPVEAKAHPTVQQRDLLVAWVEKELFQADPAHPDPGRVTIHRLNRSEYNNTIRDLVGVKFSPAEDFPADDSGSGFDNIGDVLSLPPVLMEKYLASATRVLDDAIATAPPASKVRHYNANLMEMGFNADGDRGDGWMPLGALEEDGVAQAIPVTAGDYIVRVQAFVRGARGGGGAAAAGAGAGAAGAGAGRGRGAATAPAVDGDAADQADEAAAAPAAPTAAGGGGGGQGLKLALMIDDAVANDWNVNGTEAKPGVYEYRVGVSDGKHRFAVVNRRLRGGANELLMKNGRIGKEQSGVIMVKWVEVEGPLPSLTRRFTGSALGGAGRVVANGVRLLDQNGEVAAKFNAAKPGDYILRAEAYADQAGNEPTRMEWRLNDKAVKTFDVLAPGKLGLVQGQRAFSMELLNPMPYVYEIPVKVAAAGEQKFSVAFTNDFADKAAQNPNLRKRNLYLKYLEVVSLNEPPPTPPVPEALKKNLTATVAAGATTAQKQAAAREDLANFAGRAWRRPATAGELDRLLALFSKADGNGETFEAALKLPMKAVLVSPAFLFRGEIQPHPDDPKDVHPIDEIALASRLSYFLWSSMPDDELLALAEKNQLRQHLTEQVQRMMASPKSQALVENFAGQWLQFRNLAFVEPDKELFPDYGPSIRDAMREETILFFSAVMRENRSVLDFLNGDFTYVNAPLAKLYGLPETAFDANKASADGFEKVSLSGTPRRGILTQGSVLTITSNPTRTSPVKRGKWVLENILGTPPPPPPPDVPELKNDGHPDSGTLRQQMEQHRANPSCASCHATMDPLGFGLEQFDGIGKYREKEGEFPIDSSGVLVSGEKFNGAVELTQILATQKRAEFVHCLADKMLTYALGRGTEYYDRPALERITAGMEKNDLRFSSLIMEIVNSVPFQNCRGEASRPAN